MVIDYGKKSELGKRRPRYFIFQKERIDIPEGPLEKLSKERAFGDKKRKRVKRDRASPSYDMEALFPFQELDSDLKEIRGKQTLPRKICSYLRVSDLPVFQWTAVDAAARIVILSFS